MRTCWSWRMRTSCARRHDSSSLRCNRSPASATRRSRGRGRQGVVVADGGDELGIALDGLDERPARPEQQAQAPGRFGGLPERRHQQ